MPELEVARHSLSIDPHLHIWGWEVAVYLFLGGMAAGVMVLTSLLSRSSLSRNARWLGFLAPVLVSVGMGALFLDLAYKVHVWRFYLAFKITSPMSWGSWILLLVYPATLLFALALLEEDQFGWLKAKAERWPLAGRLMPLLASARMFALAHLDRLRWVHLGLGIALGIYTGILLSTLGARAIWNSALLGPLFLASGTSAGAALFRLLPLSKEEHHTAARWDLWAMGAEILLLVLVFVGLGTSGAGGAQALQMILGGPFTAVFWSLVVLLGLLLPLMLEWLEHRLALRATVFAPLCVLAGGYALRWVFVMAGQAH